MILVFLRRVVPFLFTGIFFFLIGLYIFENYGTLSRLFNASLSKTSLIALLVILATIGRGAINLIFYKQFNIPISLFEGVGLAIINTLGNLLPFSGGLIGKGVYLRKKFQVNFSKYFSATISLYFCFISVNGAVGLICLFLLSLFYKREISYALLAGFLCMTCCLGIIWFPFSFNFVPAKHQNLIANAREGWVILGQKRLILMEIILLQFIGLVLIGFRLWLVFGLFSLHLNFFACLLFAAVMVLTSLVNIVPGGIGIREAIIGGTSFLIGYPFGFSILAVALDRAFAIIVTLIMAPFFLLKYSSNFSHTNQ